MGKLPKLKSVNIKGNFAKHSEDKLIIPYAVTFNMQTLPYKDYEYEINDDIYSIKLKEGVGEQKQLAVFGIISISEANRGSSTLSPGLIALIVIIILLLVLSLVILFHRRRTIIEYITGSQK